MVFNLLGIWPLVMVAMLVQDDQGRLKAWQVNYFVNVMTIDFFLFAIAFAAVLADDMRRRDMKINGRFWLYALVPVLGAVTYLTVRPSLAQKTMR